MREKFIGDEKEWIFSVPVRHQAPGKVVAEEEAPAQ